MKASVRIGERYRQDPGWFKEKTINDVAQGFGVSYETARSACLALGIVLTPCSKRPGQKPGITARAVELLETQTYARGELQAALGLNEPQLKRLVSCLRAKRPDLAAKITVKRDRELERYMWRRAKSKRGFTVDDAARKTGRTTADVMRALATIYPDEKRRKRFLWRMRELKYKYKYTRGEKVRDQEWLDDVARVNGLGFEFTGVYWKRYRKLWWKRKRKERPL